MSVNCGETSLMNTRLLNSLIFSNKALLDIQENSMTLKNLAEMAGVSQATVSLVRKGKRGVSDSVRAKTQEMLHEYGFSYAEYNPDAVFAPSNPRQKRMRTHCPTLPS